MNFKELRKSKSIRMIELASQLGVSQGHFSNIERGKRPLNNDMLNKIASILKEPVSTVQGTFDSNNYDSVKIKSWLSGIRINGLPFIKAFRYYIEHNNLHNQITDDVVLRNILKQFIESNIGLSVVAEISENKALLQHIRERIGVTEVANPQKEFHEQLTGTK